eukprot:5056560-Pyramimonas_sp.AAC.1
MKAEPSLSELASPTKMKWSARVCLSCLLVFPYPVMVVCAQPTVPMDIGASLSGPCSTATIRGRRRSMEDRVVCIPDLCAVKLDAEASALCFGVADSEVEFNVKSVSSESASRD